MDLRQVRDHELFNRIAWDYSKKDLVHSTAFVRKQKLLGAVKFLLEKQQKFDTVLEIGCGIGAPSRYLDGYYNKYIGVDYSEALIDIARSLNDKNNVSFFVSDLTNMQIDVKADIILAYGVLHHVFDHDKLMQSLKKHAKPGAYFIAIEPQRSNPLILFFRWIRKRVDDSYSKEQLSFRPAELLTLLKNSHFEEISYEFQGFFSTPFGEAILRPQFIFVPIAKLALLIDSLLDKLLPNFLKFMSWSIVIRAKFPQTTIVKEQQV